ncbi:HSF_DOMAIN domain-containing protein [Trichonephila clavipes]|nr:HSF_DOMAIN domain-containing protein [Trichonephila clavipes]
MSLNVFVVVITALERSQELWFQQDGATCHTDRTTIDLLKDTFGDRLISRFGPVNLSPRSCDLTPLDYFLWGYVKSLVYADKPQTLDHLEDNIRRVIADIRPQMLEKEFSNENSENRFDEEIIVGDDSCLNQPIEIENLSQTVQYETSGEQNAENTEVQPLNDASQTEHQSIPAELVITNNEETPEPKKKKRGRKPGSKQDPNKTKLLRFAKLHRKQRKDFAPTLKRPELYPNLIYYDDEDSSCFLRNTSPGVMLSSTLPFQESPEYRDLKEMYRQQCESKIRQKYSSLPLNILGRSKVLAINDQIKHIIYARRIRM